LKLNDIAQTLDVTAERIYVCLKELAGEGMMARIFKNRTAYYTLK
jgi:predicted transcriptional regulator